MVTLLLMTVLTMLDPEAHHVRAAHPKLNALLKAGITRSVTFRSLVEALDQSDVIVYVEPHVNRDGLGAYLKHRVIAVGSVRYLYVAADLRGAPDRLIPLLAHELQHALEVAGHAEVRDERGVDELFDRLDMRFGCSLCTETRTAVDVELAVQKELKAAR